MTLRYLAHESESFQIKGIFHTYIDTHSLCM